MEKANRSFRVAVIGCGAICGNHMNAILKSGNSVCALCDIEASKAEDTAKRYGLENIPIYTDYTELLDKEEPDSIHVCTPHYLHAEMCINALKRNVNVLCEKPLCISLEQLENIRTAVKDSHAYLGVCLQNRYEPNFKYLKEMSSEGVVSGVGLVVWDRGEDYYRSADWRGTADKEGGGVMINQALHTVDLLQWVFGMPEKITANISNDRLKGVIEVEDTASALFELADGRRFNIYATNSSGAYFPATVWFKLSSGKTVYASNELFMLDNKPFDFKADGNTVGKLEWGTGHEMLVSDFYQSIASGHPFDIGVEEGAKSVRLILGMYSSCGECITVPK